MEILPAHWIVQRVRAGIAPVAIKLIFRQRGARAGQFKQLVTCKNGDLGAQHFGFGCGDGSGGHRFFTGCGDSNIDQLSGAPQQRFGGMQTDLQVADGCNGERIVAGALLAAVDPRA